MANRIHRTRRNGSSRIGTAAIAAALVVTAGLGSSPAVSQTTMVQARQPLCKPWRDVASELGDKYAEHPVAYGLQPDGNLLQVFVSEQTGTWTLVTMRPNGTACLVGAGQGWEALPKPVTGPIA